MEGRGRAEDEEDPFGRGKSGVAGAWVGMSRSGGGEFSPLRENCCVELRSGPTHDLFRCFACAFSTFFVHSVFSLYPPSMLHSLVLSGYYFMAKGALKPCLWHLGVRPEEWT